MFSREGKWENWQAKGTSPFARWPPLTLRSAGLARRLVDFDLTSSIRIGGRASDDPLVWWAGGPRAMNVTTVDSLWLRLVDVDTALTARGYSGTAMSSWTFWTRSVRGTTHLAADG